MVPALFGLREGLGAAQQRAVVALCDRNVRSVGVELPLALRVLVVAHEASAAWRLNEVALRLLLLDRDLIAGCSGAHTLAVPLL